MEVQRNCAARGRILDWIFGAPNHWHRSYKWWNNLFCSKPERSGNEVKLTLNGSWHDLENSIIAQQLNVIETRRPCVEGLKSKQCKKSDLCSKKVACSQGRLSGGGIHHRRWRWWLRYARELSITVLFSFLLVIGFEGRFRKIPLNWKKRPLMTSSELNIDWWPPQSKCSYKRDPTYQ